MIRNLIVFFLFLFGAFFTGLYVAYGQIDPCRALAVEEARRSAMPTGIAELWARISNGGMTRPACTKALFDSWRERLTH